jgi:multiple sugar transport system permease protein
MAASVITTLPMILLFVLGQRYFVEGIQTTGRANS